MKIFGLPISWKRAEKALNSVDQNRGGWIRILESFAGAWQQNVEVDYNSVLSNHADFACKTLIASDVAKLRVKLVAKDADGIWNETKNPAYSPVLRKPNHWQNRIQFYENWVISKLQRGNTVILKQRDGRGVVVAMHILEWTKVRPLIADNGDVFYELDAEKLAGIGQKVVVPAREVIHDRFNCLFHPLIGLSPIFAGGLAAVQGNAILEQATQFFQNGGQPGGVLTAPGAIDDKNAERVKKHWEDNYTGKNRGKVAVLGDGLKYEAMSMKHSDAQLIEQLKWTAEVICSVYHVPPYKIGVGTMPTNNNVQSLNVEYYSQALQILMEAIELCLDEGLGTGEDLGTEFDVDNLLRMDSVSQMEVIDKGKNTLTPNEGRKRLNLKPVTGGNSVFRQQQDYSLEALAKRDAQADPFKTGSAAVAGAPPAANDDEDISEEEAAVAARAFLYAEFKEAPAVLALPKPEASA